MSNFESGLKSIDDQYATLSGLNPAEKGDNAIEPDEVPEDEQPEEFDAEAQGLQPREGDKPAAKKTAAKKAKS
jgi:hypothetical protein